MLKFGGRKSAKIISEAAGAEAKAATGIAETAAGARRQAAKNADEIADAKTAGGKAADDVSGAASKAGRTKNPGDGVRVEGNADGAGKSVDSKDKSGKVDDAEDTGKTPDKKKTRTVQEESSGKTAYKNKEFPTRTKPSGQRGGKPTGERTVNKPNSKSEYKRSIKRENEAADILANKGYKVEQNPVIEGLKDPDYRIEGKIFDCYAPKTDNPRSILSHIATDKIGKKQTKRIVLNLTDSNLQRHALRQALNEAPIDGLKEIILIDKNKNIILFYP